MVLAQPLVIHQARWVVPVEGPLLANGAVVVAGDRIAALGPAAMIRALAQTGGLGQGPVQHYDHGQGAIIPALVNSHLHLEFSALRSTIAPQPSLPAWLEAAMGSIITVPPAQLDQGVRAGIAAMRRFGTVLAAEVSNTGRSLPWLTASGLDFHYFYECLGFDLLQEGSLADDFPFLNRPECERLPVSAAAHAPYSVSAPLFRRIKDWNRARQRPTSVHLAESWEEIHFLRYGRGPFQRLLARRGRWYDSFAPPGCSPAVYLDQLGFWAEPALAVHGVWLEAPDRELLARRGVCLALCPRSNLHTGAGFPDLTALQQAGVKLALGTDSLASSPDFNLFQEMQVLLARFPEVPGPDLLAMATINGAVALHRAQDLGSLSVGKKAALLFLPLAPGAPFWPGLLASGAQGRIYWLTPTGKEVWHGA
jgi:aminodeoxyfutalosine deaminase